MAAAPCRTRSAARHRSDPARGEADAEPDGPDHTGDELYRCAARPTSRGEHYARQVIAGDVRVARA